MLTAYARGMSLVEVLVALLIFSIGMLGAALLFLLQPMTRTTLRSAITLPPGSILGIQQQQGIVGSVATPLFGAYLVPFEIASVLLLAAIVGAVVLAKRKL